MYADRYGPRPINRSSLTLSLAIVGGLVTTAMLSNTVIHRDFGRSLRTYVVPPAPPPPKPEPQPRPHPQAQSRTEQVIRHDPIVPTLLSDPPFTTSADPGPPVMPGIGTGEIVAPVYDPPKPDPVLRGADVDPRYFRDFQPSYPAEERRAGTEGVVTIRVLIGVDGRVRQVERVAAASEAFWRVTEQRALAKWRFRAATRDGIPYESWKTMTVRFRLEADD